MKNPKPIQPNRGLSVRSLLILINGLLGSVPIVTWFGLWMIQSQVIVQTEMKLIAEGIIAAESYRQLWSDESGLPIASPSEILPPDTPDPRFHPIEPILRGSSEVLPALLNPTDFVTDKDGPDWRAGKRMEALLERAQVFNLTGVHVLNLQGEVLASSTGRRGARYGELAEVREALAGRYHAVLRKRHLGGFRAAPIGISSNSDIKVNAALPIFDRGVVIGVVWMVRTIIEPLKAIYLSRQTLLWFLLGSFMLMSLTSLWLSRQIIRPLRRLTQAALDPLPTDRLMATTGWTVPKEIRTLSAALASMRCQLVERADYAYQYANHVSHELKSPITSIRGSVELMLEDAESMPPEQRKRFLQNIQTDANRLNRLVSRLLSLARVESTADKPESIELVSFLKNLIESFGPQVMLELDQPPQTINMVPDQLEMAVSNLIENAIRHGDGKPVIVRAYQRGNRCCLEVQDHGPGIPDAVQKNLFAKFFTTERARGGTGLGLVIVKTIVEAHGGSIGYQTGSTGTTFSLAIPFFFDGKAVPPKPG